MENSHKCIFIFPLRKSHYEYDQHLSDQNHFWCKKTKINQSNIFKLLHAHMLCVFHFWYCLPNEIVFLVNSNSMPVAVDWFKISKNRVLGKSERVKNKAPGNPYKVTFLSDIRIKYAIIFFVMIIWGNPRLNVYGNAWFT